MKALILILITCLTVPAFSQMNNSKLEKILTVQTDSVQGSNGRWQLLLNEMPMIVLTDETNDRMRIIAPIIESSKLDEDLLLDCLTANFHSALDVKYAISEGLLWSVYIHPLSPLTKMEIESAIKQVYSAAVTFGTTFSSTPLLFGGNPHPKTAPLKKDTIIYKKT